MPKAPILDREAYFVRLSDGTYTDFDWHLVNTSLGAMVESRGVLGVPPGRMLDALDASVNRRLEINPDQFYARTGVNGTQVLREMLR